MYVCVRAHVCACVRERERGISSACVSLCMCGFVRDFLLCTKDFFSFGISTLCTKRGQGGRDWVGRGRGGGGGGVGLQNKRLVNIHIA